MTSLHKAGPLATLLTLTALLAGAHSARANDPDLRATTVPAAECQPENDTQDARVTLSGGAWTFNSTSTGTITFYCPLPINGNTEFDAFNDNDMTMIRVLYRDTDGMGAGAEVTARLLFRTPGLFSVGAAWSSNSSNVMVDTTAFHPLVHDLFPSVLYSFFVTLSRTSTVDNPAFFGIDFP
jgi:hypothetical protein